MQNYFCNNILIRTDIIFFQNVLAKLNFCYERLFIFIHITKITFHFLNRVNRLSELYEGLLQWCWFFQAHWFFSVVNKIDNSSTSFGCKDTATHYALSEDSVKIVKCCNYLARLDQSLFSNLFIINKYIKLHTKANSFKIKYMKGCLIKKVFKKNFWCLVIWSDLEIVDLFSISLYLITSMSSSSISFLMQIFVFEMYMYFCNYLWIITNILNRRYFGVYTDVFLKFKHIL